MLLFFTNIGYANIESKDKKTLRRRIQKLWEYGLRTLLKSKKVLPNLNNLLIKKIPPVIL